MGGERCLRKEIVQCLSVCGAARCAAGRVGCKRGCADRRSLGLVASETTALSLAAIDDPAPKPAASLLDIKQEACMKHVLAAARRGSRRPSCLVSFDGGGIRGLVIVQMLLALEQLMGGENLWPFVDWAAGTSTGSFVLVGLALGKSVREVQHIYLRLKDQLFEGATRPYSTTALESLIKHEIGENTKLSDILSPKYLITAAKADTSPLQLKLFRNYRLPLSDAENVELGYTDPQEDVLWRALRCSSAAPTYYSSVDGVYVDGGLIANNPTLDLLTEFHHYNAARQAVSQEKEEIGVVLSVGTGKPPDVPLESLDFGGLTSNPYTTAITVKTLGYMLIEEVTETEARPVERSRAWCHSLDVPFFRLSAPLSTNVPMDTTNDAQLVNMMWDAVLYMHSQATPLNQLVDLLRKLRDADDGRFQANETRPAFH